MYNDFLYHKENPFDEDLELLEQKIRGFIEEKKIDTFSIIFGEFNGNDLVALHLPPQETNEVGGPYEDRHSFVSMDAIAFLADQLEDRLQQHDIYAICYIGDLEIDKQHMYIRDKTLTRQYVVSDDDFRVYNWDKANLYPF